MILAAKEQFCNDTGSQYSGQHSEKRLKWKKLLCDNAGDDKGKTSSGQSNGLIGELKENVEGIQHSHINKSNAKVAPKINNLAPSEQISCRSHSLTVTTAVLENGLLRRCP